MKYVEKNMLRNMEVRNMEVRMKLKTYGMELKKNILTLSHSGFDATKNKTSAYGIGTYVSTSALYSYGYSAKNSRKKDDKMVFMFNCDILAGKTCTGILNTNIPKEFDTGTGPGMYIVPNDDAIIPRYIIAFYPYAS